MKVFSDIKQSSFDFKVEGRYFTQNRDTPLEEARRKTVALVEIAKSMGLVVTLESTSVRSRYPGGI